jgi:type IV pilus assembly protein PilW
MLKQHKTSGGFSLTELMIAMLLGMFVVGAVIGVYISNNNTNRMNQQIANLQQASQVSFQLLSQDVQHAGYFGCNNVIQQHVFNALNPPLVWWNNWTGGIQGFEFAAFPNFSNGAVAPLAGTDALLLMYGRGVSASVVNHNPLGNPAMVINENLAGIVPNDIAMACESEWGLIFQVTAVNGTSLSHAVGAGAPGNRTLQFGVTPAGTAFTREISNDAGFVMPMETAAWFVGTRNNINSLYRVVVIAGQQRVEEIIPNVQNLQLQYLVAGTANYVDANLVPPAAWELVVSVRAVLTLEDSPQMPVAVNMRQISQVVNLRNRR